MATNTGFSILNLRDGGQVDLVFPEEITTSDRTNWQDADVAGGVKPLFFANVDGQRINIDELCIDHTRDNSSVEPVISKLRSWMRPNEGNPAPPPLQILTADWQQRGTLTELQVRRTFWTTGGVCIRAYLALTFDELPSSGLRIDATTRRRSGNSLSGRT